jgi:hypothetical protein
MAGWASVIYDWTDAEGESFSYTYPTFLSRRDVIQCNADGSVDCLAINFIPNSDPFVGGRSRRSYDVVQLALGVPGGAGGSTLNTFFANGAFLQFGEYDELLSGGAHLVVREGPSSVPQPGMLAPARPGTARSRRDEAQSELKSNFMSQGGRPRAGLFCFCARPQVFSSPCRAEQGRRRVDMRKRITSRARK